MTNPPIQDILDLAYMLTNVPLSEDGHELMDRYEAREMSFGELIAVLEK